MLVVDDEGLEAELADAGGVAVALICAGGGRRGGGGGGDAIAEVLCRVRVGPGEGARVGKVGRVELEGDVGPLLELGLERVRVARERDCARRRGRVSGERGSKGKRPGRERGRTSVVGAVARRAVVGRGPRARSQL